LIPWTIQQIPQCAAAVLAARLPVGACSLYGGSHKSERHWGIVMAKKKRKSVIVKRKKKSKTTAKKRKLHSRRRRSLRQKVSNAYRTVVDTIKGTDRLRNKMEPTGTTETE
jgi:hypothetical protein